MTIKNTDNANTKSDKASSLHPLPVKLSHIPNLKDYLINMEVIRFRYKRY